MICCPWCYSCCDASALYVDAHAQMTWVMLLVGWYGWDLDLLSTMHVGWLEVQPQVNTDCEFLLFVSVCIDLLGQDSTSHRRVQFRLAPFASVQSIWRLHVFLSVKLWLLSMTTLINAICWARFIVFWLERIDSHSLSIQQFSHNGEYWKFRFRSCCLLTLLW